MARSSYADQFGVVRTAAEVAAEPKPGSAAPKPINAFFVNAKDVPAALRGRYELEKLAAARRHA